MFVHRSSVDAPPITRFHWLLLSLNGGLINSGGFLATGRFVSHVTGFATLFGVSLGNGQIEAAVEIISVPVFFLLGSFTAGMLIDRPLSNHKHPHFDLVMGISAICLLIASFSDYFLGPFGEINKLNRVYFLLSLLCLSCGLQNAAIASSSGGAIRTTHLTGLTTDLGLGLSRLTSRVSGPKGDENYRTEMRTNFFRATSIFSFILGSAIGAFLFIRFGFRGFWVPAAIAAYSAFQGNRMKGHFK